MLGLLRGRTFALGMAATTLAFMGQFSLSTYLRPFLEDVTGIANLNDPYSITRLIYVDAVGDSQLIEL